uniref:Glutathione peroxidase n=1 Tax=Strigamia maritima TaxID=126957 RepID=T1IH16_STRMM
MTKKQYPQLQDLYEKYGESKGLRILAFPCNQFGNQEPWPEAEIKEFLKQFNVSFDLFSKIKVNGDEAHPLFKYLKHKQGGTLGDFIKWNFTKFLIDKQGQPVKRYAPTVEPNKSHDSDTFLKMASSDAAVIDVESSGQSDADVKLQFQDFTDSNYGDDSQILKPQQTHMFTSFPDSIDDDTEHSDLLGEKKPPSVWTFEYYQSFFNVDTNDVLRRIFWSMLPRPGMSYLQYHIRPNPDLYGPFWICTTLIFTTAIMGNLANYLTVANSGNYLWHYDFQKVTLSATTIYAYASLTPLLIWIFLWYRNAGHGCTFLEIICVYGYSLSVYVPLSIFWVIQVRALQWILVVIGSILSGTVLLMTFWPTVSHDSRKVSISVMVIIAALHFMLATGFLLYFFHVPNLETHMTTTQTAAISTLTPALTSTTLPTTTEPTTTGVPPQVK